MRTTPALSAHSATPARGLVEFAAHRTSALSAYTAVAQDLETPPADAPVPATWSGAIGMESEMTGDGRIIDHEALEWSTPVPLRFVLEDNGGHDGAVTVGRILSISRGKGGRIEASGDFDLGSENGREAARLVGSEILNGVSMDLDSVSFELRVAGEVMSEMENMLTEDGELAELEEDEDGRVTVAKMGVDDEVMVTTSARIRAATLVSIPAFSEAKIYASESPAEDLEENLVASAAPIEPPQEWFMDPQLSGPTALTITDDGQVYGHLATWDTCHVGDPSGSGACVMAPKSQTGYAYFHTGAVKTKQGTLVPTGTLRFQTGHASLKSNASDASAHYDNTGMAGADVHAGEDQHGIWVAGALRPGISKEQVRTLRASPLSGDWRYVDGRLELVGALHVNLAGFPIPRTQGMVASGEMTAMVAAGVIAPKLSEAELAGISREDLSYLQRMVGREKAREKSALRSRVDNAVGRRKVAGMAAQRARSLSTTTAVTTSAGGTGGSNRKKV